MRIKNVIGMILSFAVLTMANVTAFAQECGFKDGGYCMAVIVTTSSSAVAVPLEGPPMAGGGIYISLYEKLWDELIKKQLATKEDRDYAFNEAAEAGGTKIGGYNIVVLATRTLQQLINKGVLTKEEAQDILDNSKD